MKIVITNNQDIVDICKDEIRKALKLLPELNKFGISIVYMNDEQISVLNKKYLDHEGPTDVLTFPFGPKEGEIVVSVETALREAKSRGIEVQGELILYTLHGALHLLGYDDHTDEEYEEMHTKEKELLEKLGYTWHWDK